MRGKRGVKKMKYKNKKMNSSTSLPMGGSQKKTSGRRRRCDHQSNPTKTRQAHWAAEKASTKRSCAEVEGERCGHLFSRKMQKPKIFTRRRAHQPIIYTNPSFVRRCDHLPATPQREWQRHLHKNQNQRGKVAGNTHTKMGGELLYQPHPKQGKYGFLFFIL